MFGKVIGLVAVEAESRFLIVLVVIPTSTRVLVTTLPSSVVACTVVSILWFAVVVDVIHLFRYFWISDRRSPFLFCLSHAMSPE